LLTDNSFECAAGSGTVNGVPVGTNRMLSVSGKDSNGTVVYYGEEPGITVTAGKDTPVGEIVCNRVDCTDYDSDDYYAEGGCGITVDCNDNDDTIYPSAIEICDDGKDNDCDGDTDCDDDECIGDVACNDTGAETIISGQWFGNAGFGDVKFDVTSEGSGIESFKVTFSDYTCETITHGGSITQTFNPADDFENRILEVNISLGGIQSSDYIAIEGTFEAAGDYISGTFELDNGTAVCSGSWNAHAGFAAPGTRIEDLAYDGTNLWATDYYDDIIYKLDPVTGEVLDSIYTPRDGPQGLAFDGNYLWGSDSTTIYKIEVTTGEVLSTFDSQNYQGLAYDGGYLWGSELYGDIYKIDPTTGVVINSFRAPGGSWPDGFTFDGTYLWLVDSLDDEIYKLDPVTGEVLDSIYTPRDGPQGVAFDGNYLWGS